MEIVRIPRIMQETSKRLLQQSKRIGFVPTMGALHNGHLSLVKRARGENDIVAASIFVNPIQFAPNEDLDRYPRDLEGDMEKLKAEQTDILFLPDAKAIYPDLFSTYINVSGLSEKLCGAFRTGHFKGVATVVNKLFNIVKPNRVYFGQKDFQQCVIIKRMNADLNMDIEIVVCPTVRENDGLAMSSRNAYLSPEERKAAGIIYKTLLTVSQSLQSGESNLSAIKKQMDDMLLNQPLVSEVQYAGIYDPDNLDELSENKKQNLVAIALKIGNTRLIDNIIVDIL